jgi:transposase
MKLYAAFDLRSSSSYLGISDEKGKRIFKKKLPNDPVRIKETLRPFKAEIEGIVVESTYNWYFLVDLLKEECRSSRHLTPFPQIKMTPFFYLAFFSLFFNL